jgi:hypothetical protein
MSTIATSGFTAGSEYATINKKFYKEVQADLDRIKTAISVESAQAHASALSEKLRTLYEPKYDVEARLKQADQVKLANKEII